MSISISIVTSAMLLGHQTHFKMVSPKDHPCHVCFI